MVKNSLAGNPQKLSDDLIYKTCQEAAIGVIKTITGSPVESIYPDKGYELENIEAFSARIELNGDWEGVLSVFIPNALALKLTSDIIGGGPGDPEEEYISEGVGEIANQIAGRMMTVLSQIGHKISIGIPKTKAVNNKRQVPGFWFSKLILVPSDSEIMLQLSADMPSAGIE